MNSNKISLKSSRIAQILLGLLWVLVTEALVSILFILVKISAISAWQNFRNNLFILPCLIVNFSVIIIFFNWIYRLHQDLCQCYKNYPICAKDAIYNFLMPFVNIWGIWKTLITIGYYFKRERGHLHHNGLLICRLVPLIYSLFIALFVVNKLFYGDTEGVVMSSPIIKNISESILPFVYAFKKIINLVFLMTILAIIKIMNNSLKLKDLQLKNQ